MKQIFFLISMALALGAQAQVSGSIVEKLRNGETCFVNIKTFYKYGAEVDCNGTIARGMTYSVRFNKADATWTATGYVCNTGRNNTHTDFGPHPIDGYVVIWGAKFKFDGDSKIFDADGKEIGRVAC